MDGSMCPRTKRRPNRFETHPGTKPPGIQLNLQSPIVLLISLFFYLGVATEVVNTDHGVLDVEFTALEELSSPTDAANMLAALSETVPRVVVFTNQLYRLRLLGLNKPIPGASFSHVASVAGYPDLPRWTFLRPHNSDLLLYGSQPNSGPVNIQIISTNQHTFDVNIRQLQLQVEPRDIAAEYEVEMKIINYNVEDVFEREILPRLERVVRTLWSTSPVVFTSKLASVLDVGGRRPLDPRHKEGFVVRVAGSGNFSSELRSLELEVRQLRNRIPCPRDYKRTSAEWRFREIGLVPDWCGFRLITNRGLFPRGEKPVIIDNGSTRSSQLAAAAASDVIGEVQHPPLARPRDGADSTSQDGNGTTSGERNSVGVGVVKGGGGGGAAIFEGPSLQDLPRRSSFEDVVVSLALPLAVCLLLLGGLSGTSLCLYASDEVTSRNNTTTGRRDSVEVENMRRPHSLRHGKN